MHESSSPLFVHSVKHSFIFILAVFLLQNSLAHSVIIPSSKCYVLDNSSYIHDFTDWIGYIFEHDGEGTDLVVRFCKDVEQRSQKGYVDFGHFVTPISFVAGTGGANFIQEFYNGDLAGCESSFDKMGRTAQVNIICGNCLNGKCQGAFGCICNVTYDSSMCRVFVELAIPCQGNGSRVFEGFTVGFHPRSWEIVYNGLTQLGYEKLRHDFSFGTQQTEVSLYLTAISALSGLVGRPVFKVFPHEGLDVKLFGSGAEGRPPTTLSPTVLALSWRCKIVRDTPYEVAISIPVENYSPVEFTLTKICEYRQNEESDATRGWATFGVLSCIFFVSSSIFCCGGFIYKSRMQHQRGVDALPGMTILSACLETVSEGNAGYSQTDNINSTLINQTSWDHVPVSSEGSQRTQGRTYGSI